MWRFLKSEMLVILGLVEDASRTDAEIAELYGLNKGTVASVRRRVTDAGAVYFVNIPSFNKLGCELMGFHLGSTDPAISLDARSSHYMEFCAKAPQVFSAMVGGNQVLMYTALKDATEFDYFCQTHNKMFTGPRRASKAKFDHALFPYTMTRGSYQTNFGLVVHRFFGLDVPPPKSRIPTHSSVESPDLSETERKTLIVMVENPLASDREISEVVGLSRQAITRIRHMLVEDGYVTLVCIPRLYRWGFEIYAVAHARFSMDVAWDRRLKSQPREVVDLSTFTLSKADEAVANYMIPRFQEYAENLDNVLAWYHKIRIFDERPEISVFALERCTEVRNYEFAPAVRHLLGMKQPR